MRILAVLLPPTDLLLVVKRLRRDFWAVVVVLPVPLVDLPPVFERLRLDFWAVAVVLLFPLVDLLLVLDLVCFAEVVRRDLLLLLPVVALGIADSPCIGGLRRPCNCVRYEFFTEPHIGSATCILYLQNNKTSGLIASRCSAAISIATVFIQLVGAAFSKTGIDEPDAWTLLRVLCVS